MRLRDRILSLLLTCIMAGSGLVTDAVGDNDLDIDIHAQVRWRPETERVIVRPGTQNRIEAAQYLRTRVRVDLGQESNTQVRLHIQDARVLGDPPSGQVQIDTRLGVFEAYLKMNELVWPWLSLQAGRFVLNYGNQRLVGEVGWSNPGRTFDAFRLGLGGKPVRLDIFAAKIDHNGNSVNDDRTFYGAVLKSPKTKSEAYAFWDYDGRKFGRNGDRLLNRVTLGVYSGHRIGESSFDYITNLAYQFGSFIHPEDPGRTDISAYLVAAEAGWSTSNSSPLRLAAGFDLASGDDDPDDVKHWAFDNLYYTGHKFRGFMDQFLPSNSAGLLDVLVRLGHQINPESRWGTDFHWFQTAREFESQETAGETSKAVGYELDAWARTKAIEHASIQIGGAIFKPTTEYAGTGNDDLRAWGYLQFIVSLP